MSKILEGLEIRQAGAEVGKSIVQRNKDEISRELEKILHVGSERGATGWECTDLISSSGLIDGQNKRIS